jgi:putative endonuclease
MLPLERLESALHGGARQPMPEASSECRTSACRNIASHEPTRLSHECKAIPLNLGAAVLRAAKVRHVMRHSGGTIISPRSDHISLLTRAPTTRNLDRVSEDPRHIHGACAEQLAADYLQAHGLAVLERNLRCKGGELDLVCLDHGVLVVVEVRQRARSDFGGAPASVNRRKQRKIIRAARFFLQRRAAWRGWAVRFDVVALDGLPGGEHRIEWIKDGFRAT